MSDVTLHLGDCLEYMRTMPAGSVDAVVTDPPWLDYETGRYDASAWHSPIVEITPDVYMPEISRVVNETGAALVFTRWDKWAELECATRKTGLNVKNCIVWAKPNHTAGDLAGNLAYQHEFALFADHGQWRVKSKRQSNLWINGHLFSRDFRHHPTEKPVSLMVRAILALTPPGATVFDPFMGSGTTGVACVRTGRNFIGCEIDLTYYAIAQRRIAEAQLQPPLFPHEAPASRPEQLALLETDQPCV